MKSMMPGTAAAMAPINPPMIRYSAVLPKSVPVKSVMRSNTRTPEKKAIGKHTRIGWRG
jgi:hypothetical protein